ncbi:unnamed protein product [Amoebophrya sp. A25]|nr:unnamed protein product [Amoebophrya sp. A25]|eukprot:GSA25T00014334001.1
MFGLLITRGLDLLSIEFWRIQDLSSTSKVPLVASFPSSTAACARTSSPDGVDADTRDLELGDIDVAACVSLAAAGRVILELVKSQSLQT